MKKLLFVILFLISCSLTAQHTGRVYIDSNKNGKYDKNEKTLTNVMISDGLNVVKTSSDGTFQLAGHKKERFIIITIPSGYKPADSYYKRISDNESYDFRLVPNAERVNNDGNHKFIQIADSEIFNAENRFEWIDNIRDYATNEKVAFIIHTGDICYEAGLKKHIKLMNSDNMGCPVFYCIGNHDLTKGNYGEELFESIYGPTYYSFDFGNVHYIVTPMPIGDNAPSYTKEDIYLWLKNDLAHLPPNKQIVLFNHNVLNSSDDLIWTVGDGRQLDFSEYNLRAFLHGHRHMHYMRKRGDVTCIGTGTPDKGGKDHSVAAFREVSIDKKGNIVSKLRYTYIDKAIQIASIYEGKVPVTAEGKIPLSVNTYNSAASVSNVSYTCSVNDKIINNGNLEQNTDWNWSTFLQLPSNYTGQTIFVEAKATYSSGEIAIARESFIYDPDNGTSLKLNGDWTNFLKDAAHTGIATDSLGTPLKLNWVTNVKANIFFTSQIIHNNMVYTASVNENYNGEGGVYALDAINGNILWKYPIRNSIKNSIAYDSGNVFAQDVDGYLYAIDATTGKLSWEKKLEVTKLLSLSEGLAAKDGVVYAGSGKGFSAFEAKSGNIIWQNKDWDQGECTLTSISVGNDVVVSGVQWRNLYGNDLITGKMLWSLKQDGLSDRGAAPTIQGNLMYVAARSTIFVIDVKSGKIIAKKDLSPIILQALSTPLITDKFIIFGTARDGVIALNKENLNIQWQKHYPSSNLIYTVPYVRPPATAIETSLILSGNPVFFGASDGNLYGLDIESGKLNWQYPVGAPVFSSMAVSGNALFVSDYAGNVYAFTPDKE